MDEDAVRALFATELSKMREEAQREAAERTRRLEEESLALKQQLVAAEAALARATQEQGNGNQQGAEGEESSASDSDRGATPGGALAEAMPATYTLEGHKIRQYGGRPTASDPRTAGEFAQEVRQALQLHHITGQAALSLVINNLKGEAGREIVLRRPKDVEDAQCILQRVFGDGVALDDLQARFFSYKQAEGVSVVTTTLDLVDLYDRMTKMNPQLESRRDQALKSRLAGAVVDPALQREMRRLNSDQPALSVFEMRDTALEHWGCAGYSQDDVLVEEVGVPTGTTGVPSAFEAVILQQSEMLRQQGEALAKLLTQCEEIRVEGTVPSSVRVAGRRPVRLPARSLGVVSRCGKPRLSSGILKLPCYRFPTL